MNDDVYRRVTHEVDLSELETSLRPVMKSYALEPDPKAEAEAERQRLMDSALADAVEVVGRHRTRLGRRVCSTSDGATVRRIFELLRAMPNESSADSDASFQ